mmetsp:Transcript_22541/g.34221  ORF Transcript_22541/g.34221 Transcript_22541/m.34221 type:complete len:81 (-) Transcript_22541:679-921(-)
MGACGSKDDSLSEWYPIYSSLLIIFMDTVKHIFFNRKIHRAAGTPNSPLPVMVTQAIIKYFFPFVTNSVFGHVNKFRWYG